MSETIEHELKCYWRGSDEPRALRKRHDDDCVDDECRGCLRCPKYHCIVCGIKHVDQQTCPECTSTVRDDLRDIVSLHLALPDHALSGGHDGRLEASRDLLGGEAMNMLVPGGQRGEIGDSEHRPTENLLVTWEDDWRKVLGNYTNDLASVEGAREFLDEHLSWAAQHHLAFDDFAEELRAHRAHLEDVLHAGERDTTGAPCPKCHKPLVLDSGDTHDDDRWVCQTRRCEQVPMTPADYTALTARAKLLAEWLDAEDMLLVYRINRGTLQSWASRRKVRKRRDFDTGRMTYNVAEALVQRDGRDERMGA
ncbi:hypothetical protein [Aeromicrobium sp. HA]|uniref:hypothetical protein n=1 Tax=Aeromicrobium sp. HA TaxID=3009077 RepID=UPI0022AF0FE4|nr:hypothetical protein [Aeromicrobium sp. HA]